uniref:Uncharacterized protein n=1 Tax=Cereibacter sphaeroides (strain ATCC 17025 / ATH 2.4.3) TaxID=349102 RepID=A4WS93_CERS5
MVTGMPEKEQDFPPPPAHIEGFVDVLGVEDTVRFLLRFGGAEMTPSSDPKGRGALEALVGYEKARAVFALPGLQKRVPLAKPWVAAVLRHQGKSVAEIARTLHVTDSSVRAYLNTRRRSAART